MTPLSALNVYFRQAQHKRLLGQLVLKNRQLFFTYNPDFITQQKLALSPFKLPLQLGVMANQDPTFEGLFGLFNDSLPDGWGRLLLDRKLIQQQQNPQQLSPLDRLSYVGEQGMGALTYEPVIEELALNYQLDLDEIAAATWQFQTTDHNILVDDLWIMNGSSAGARPKIMLEIDEQAWLVKFRSSLDPLDIGAIEYAYHLMAQAAKLDLPSAKLFTASRGAGYFGVKRFDRKGKQRVHMHTMSGLWHLDHRFPTLDYELIMQTTVWLTKDITQCEKQFRAAVFNVLAHNRDDHAKNFSFLMDETGKWQVSPAYDLTFSAGPSGEHCSMVMGEGKHPTLMHLLKLAKIGGIKTSIAQQIIEEVRAAIAQWQYLAKNAGVSRKMLTLIQVTLDQVTKNFV